MNDDINVKEFKFNEPLIHKIDSIIDNCIRDCHNKYFHTFDHKCVYVKNFTNITNIETVIFTLSHKNMSLYELNRNLTVARGNGFKFNRINKLTIKIFSNLSHINIHYYLKLQIHIMHRQFFGKLSQIPDYVQTQFNNRNNLFHSACCKWYLYNNPHC